VLINASEAPGVPANAKSGVAPNTCGCTCTGCPTDVTLTNDYKTCTGSFGACWSYAEAKNVTYAWWSYIGTGLYSIQQSCGAMNWLCQGIGPTSSTHNQDCYNCLHTSYGPQLYTDQLNRSQTKYSDIRLHPNGSSENLYFCTGDLC
jgi:hypothetical protein